jgi:hypothetical protein
MQWKGRKFADDLEAMRKKLACPNCGLKDVVEVLVGILFSGCKRLYFY